MTAMPPKVRVLCVDDNADVAEALKIKLARAGRYEWLGWLSEADALVRLSELVTPALVLLDLDMPGRDPFAAVEELASKCPEARVVVFSGHVRPELVEKALQAGAWGYVSKSDGEDELLKAIAQVVDTQVALSPEARAAYDRI